MWVISRERWCTSFPSPPKLCKIYTCFQVVQASDIQELKWEIILNTPPPPGGKTLHLLQNYSSKAVLTSTDKNLECFASQIGFSSPGTFLSKLSATCKWGTVVLSLKKAHKNTLQTFIKAWSLLMKIVKGFMYDIRMRKCYDMWWNNCSPRKYRSLILVKLETETQAWWPDDISSRFIFSYFTVIVLYNIWKIHAYCADLQARTLITVVLLKQFSKMPEVSSFVYCSDLKFGSHSAIILQIVIKNMFILWPSGRVSALTLYWNAVNHILAL